MEVSKSKTSLAQLTSLRISFDFPIISEFMMIGIDPGTVNLGIAVLDVPNGTHLVYEANLYQVKFAQRAIDVLGRIKAIQEALDQLCLSKWQKTVVIEGASYGDKFRQVEMEDVRAACVMWFDKHHATSHVVAPNTIRKNAFGNAKIKADEYWECLELYPDAAAALSCAICCLS